MNEILAFTRYNLGDFFSTILNQPFLEENKIFSIDEYLPPEIFNITDGTGLFFKIKS